MNTRLVLKHLLLYTPTKPKLVPVVPKGMVKAKANYTTMKPGGKLGKKKKKNGKIEKTPKIKHIWVLKGDFALI